MSVSAAKSSCSAQTSPKLPWWCPLSWEHIVLGGQSWSTRQLLALSQAPKLGQAQKARDQRVSLPPDGCAQERGGEESKFPLLLLQERGRCSLAGKSTAEQELSCSYGNAGVTEDFRVWVGSWRAGKGNRGKKITE